MVIRSLAKQIQHCYKLLGADPNPFIIKACSGLFMSYLMIFKCALAIWLRSLTIEISDVPRTGEDVSMPSRIASII